MLHVHVRAHAHVCICTGARCGREQAAGSRRSAWVRAPRAPAASRAAPRAPAASVLAHVGGGALELFLPQL
eukprot:1381820-Prymnesium_polylepis.1